MKASDVMVTEVITVTPGTRVEQIAETLLANHISAVPVVDEAGSVLGIVSEGDLIHRAEAGTERRRVSTAAGFDPQWRADGRELYYLSRDNVLMAVAINEGEDFVPGVPVPLFRFQPNPVSVSFGSSYAPAPDGQHFVISELVGAAEPQLIATLNWQTD